MPKRRTILFLGLLALSTITLNAQTMNFHSFKVNDINGEAFDFKKLKGKKVLVVNTASECGLTPQYESLEKLYNEYGDENFVIIGFPANNFGGQEPGSDEEIKAFCQQNYGLSFPMMSKISVKGEDQHEVYQWLTKKSKNGVEDAEVSWNFQKFMIDEEGNYVGMIPPQESPLSKKILSWIKQ